MTDLDYSFTPAHELSLLVQTREVSPVDLVEHSLGRIAALNPTLNAFVELNEEHALSVAKEQATLLAEGNDIGPLAGLPLGVKDLENAAGFNTTNGSRLYRDNQVSFDDTHIARLKQAGAIVLGKTNNLGPQ